MTNHLVTLALITVIANYSPKVSADSPASLIGIAIDRPMQIPRCASYEKESRAGYYPETDICWHPNLSIGFDAAEQGEFSIVTILMDFNARPDFVSSDVSAILMKGKVVQVSVPTKGDLSWHELEKLLTEKFGKPSQVLFRPLGEHSSHYSERKLTEGVEVEHLAFGRKQFEHRGVLKATSRTLRNYYEQARVEQKKGQLEL